MENTNIVRLIKASDLERLISSRESYLVYKKIGDICLLVTRPPQDFGEIDMDILNPDMLCCIPEGNIGLRDKIMWEALNRTMRWIPPRLLDTFPYNGDDFMNWSTDFSEYNNNYSGILYNAECGVGLRLTTTNWYGGAIAIFYPWVAKKIYEILKTEFCFYFPSNNEVSIVPINYRGIKEIRESIVNYENGYGKIKMSKGLTDSIYRYDSQRDTFEMVVSSDWQSYNHF